MRIVLLHPPIPPSAAAFQGKICCSLRLALHRRPADRRGPRRPAGQCRPWPHAPPHDPERSSATAPTAVLIGHSGSTSAHPTVLRIAAALKAWHPDLTIVYGGVHPTYHWHQILSGTADIDVILRGEGEETVTALMGALEAGSTLQPSPASPTARTVCPCHPARADDPRPRRTHRIGWELIDFTRHSYWGGKRAVIVQFSRGCPHLCTYCGQRGFWTRWRHRDPVRLAREIAWLVREKGVELINLADENPLLPAPEGVS
ncbi:MAG: cobalamin-dependent protein [Defluviimonas denitrificans]